MQIHVHIHVHVRQLHLPTKSVFAGKIYIIDSKMCPKGEGPDGCRMTAGPTGKVPTYVQGLG